MRRLLRFDAASIQYLVALAVATVPAVFVGLLFKDTIEGFSNRLVWRRSFSSSRP